MKKLDSRVIGISFLPVLLISLSLLVLKSMIAAFVSYHILVCLILPILYIQRYPVMGSTLVKTLGLSRVNIKASVLTGVLLGISFFITIVGFFALFGSSTLSKTQIETLLTNWGYNKDFVLLLTIYFVFFNSVVEEVFWRGFLFSLYRNIRSALSTSVIISLCFIQYHFVTIWLLFSLELAIIFTIMLFFVNMLWCYMRLKYQNIYPAIISHLFADLAIMYVYYQYVLL